MRTVSLDDKYAMDKSRAYMTGIEALARLPMLQHQRDLQRGLNTAGFISGYRGSPLGGLDQALWKAKPWLDRHTIHFQPGVNEDLAATAVWGSQQSNLFGTAKYDGVFGMWYGKGPGVDRSMDVIKHANAFGTARYGGVLAVAGDDHACKSSTLPHQSEHMFIGASVPVLSPCNVQEVLDLGVYGWELSRYSGCWVALKAITENMDSAISADINPDRLTIRTPDEFDLPPDGVHGRWPDKPLEQELRLNKYKIYAAREFARANNLNRIVIDTPAPRFGIITCGKAYLDVMQALEDMGITPEIAGHIGLRVYKVGMSWPLEPRTTHEFAEGLEEILVVEEKRSIIEDQLTGQLYNYPVKGRPRVYGEFDEHGGDLLPNTGELTPAIVACAIAARISSFYQSETMTRRINWIAEKKRSLARPKGTLERVPHFCSGCPHNTSTRVPDGSYALGGIGCHYMALWMPDRETNTFTQMGGEGATWIGQAPFTGTRHVFQNLGDGTYFHSGALAIRAAVASGVNITYKILYNDAVAMTGGQALDGSLSVRDLIRQVSAEGVQRIALVSDRPERWRGQFGDTRGFTLHDRREMDLLQTTLRDYTGTSVIVYEQTCAAEKRRRRKKGTLDDPPKRLFINEAVCEGCGDCGVQSNCLSILPHETELGRKRKIDQNACNKDYSCAEGFCPSFVSVIGGKLKRARTHSPAKALFDPLPAPRLPALDRPWNTVVSGVGGTGVLTVTALITMAAHIEGKGAATLNQTGLAQKFGAVISYARVSASQNDIKAVRIPAGEADLLLGCDLVVASSDETMSKVARDRSHAIINEAEVPTAAFILDPDMQFPTQASKDRLAAEVGEENAVFINSSSIAVKLLGDTIANNLFLLGFAWQRGLVPVSAEALEQAIELNGVAVEFNKRAFLWGRRYAHQPEKVENLVNPEEPNEKPVVSESLDELIADREKRLVSYQNSRYAEQFRERIDAMRHADFNPDRALTRAAAKNLYKLMAYKDEYEVARLYSNSEFKRKLDAQFEGGYSLRFHLAAPLVSRRDPTTGHLIKREYGPWLMPVFRALSALRFLRGSSFDIFAYSAERRLERTDIEEYLELMDTVSAELSQLNYPLALELLQLPSQLRGFGHIKERNRKELCRRKMSLLKQFNETQDTTVVTVVEPAKTTA